MKVQPRPSMQSASRIFRRAVRWLFGRSVVQAGAGNDQGSYVGLFQGVIETDAPASPRPLHRPAAKASSGPVPRPGSAVGKLHLEARQAQGNATPGENLTIRFV